MKPVAKVGVVVVGYLAAIAIACVALSIYVATTSGPDRQTYGAMFAFGDSLYFLGVLGVSAISPQFSSVRVPTLSENSPDPVISTPLKQ